MKKIFFCYMRVATKEQIDILDGDKIMIKITDEMRSAKQKRIEEVCQRVDRKIEQAVKEKKCHCFFTCDMDADCDVYNEVKQMYQAEGYKIVPYGYSGGVWQRAENICW